MNAWPADEELAGLWLAPAVRQRWCRLLAMLAPVPGERVLDVGCGRGQALSVVAGRVGPAGLAVGVDIVVAPSGGSTLAQASADALPLPTGAFDAVLCVNALEAVREPAQALSEMRRVLRPGGRLLLAHDDYESQVYACRDRELCRRAVRAYADSTLSQYAASDGQMGRRLWGLVRAGGFRDAQVAVLPLVETEYGEPHLGWTHSRFSSRLVAGVSDLADEDLERWRHDLEECGRRGEYVYCVNMYACLARVSV